MTPDSIFDVRMHNGDDTAYRRARMIGRGPGHNGWQFTLGSSGPFGEDTDGSWQPLDEAAYTWVAYQLGYSHCGAPSLDVWHDVHATRMEDTG